MNDRSDTTNGGSATFRPTDSDDFQTAAVAAQQSHGQDWHVMSSREQAKAIYAELQKIDAKRTKAVLKGYPSRSRTYTNK